MNKVKLVTIGLVVGGIIGTTAILGQNFLAAKRSVTEPLPTITPAPFVEKSVWDDQSGFTFEYPKNLILDPHNEDKNSYAHLELKDNVHPGKIIVWTKDSQAADMKGYLKMNKIPTSLDTTLGGREAKKIIAENEERIVKVATIKDSYLYEVEYYPADESYWNPIFDSLLISFKFKPSEMNSEENTPQSASREDASGGNFNEEETVE